MAIFGFDCYVTNSAVYNVATISESGNDGHAYGYIYVRGMKVRRFLPKNLTAWLTLCHYQLRAVLPLLIGVGRYRSESIKGFCKLYKTVENESTTNKNYGRLEVYNNTSR